MSARYMVIYVHRGVPAGPRRYAIRGYARAQAEEGKNVIIVCPREEHAEGKEEDGRVAIERCAVGYGGGLLRNARFVGGLFDIMKKVADENPGQRIIGHINFYKGAFLLPVLARMLLPRLDCRWVCDVRIGSVRAGFAEVLRKWLIVPCLFTYSWVTFPSEHVRDRMLPAALRRRAEVLPLGADFRVFRPMDAARRSVRKELKLSDEEIVLVYSGIMEPTRRLHVVLEAFKMVCGSDYRARLLMVGDGSDLRRLKRASKRLGLDDKVIFTGDVEQDDVPRWLSAADLGISFVPITPQFDVQPVLKTVEYFACGLPVIATDTLGNRELVEDGVNGLLTKDEAGELARKMLSIVGDRRVRSAMASNARKTPALRKHDYRRISKETLTPMYEGMLRDRERF